MPKMPKVLKNFHTFAETPKLPRKFSAELFAPCPIIKSTWTRSTVEIENVLNPPFNFANNSFESFYNIQNVSRTHENTYVCKFENSKGIDEMEVKLIVQYPPKIKNVTIQIQNETEKVADKKVAIFEGKNAKFMCNVDAFPAPKITWNLNSTKIGDQNLLQIDNVQASGVIECIAENIVGKSVKKFEVVLNFPPRSSASKSQSLQFIHNNYAEIHCEIDAQPEPTFKWKFNDNEIKDVKKFETKNKKRIISFIAKSTDQGKFTCEAENEFGKTSLDFNVVVKTLPTIQGPKNEPKHIVRGENFKLFCDVSSFPLPQIKILLNDRVLSTSSVYQKSKAQMSDAGIYTCVAENLIGNATKIFNVTVNELPEVTSKFDNITLNVNLTITITCKAKGIPEPKIKWIFNGTEQVEFDGPNLTLSSTNDRGYYKCVASNVVGIDEEMFYANIRLMEPFANITKIKKEVHIREKDTLELICPFKNFETIKWFQNRKEMSGSTFELAENRLKIKQIKKEHAGNWNCNVWSMKDKLAFEYKLDVSTMPRAKVEWFKNKKRLNYNENFDIEEGEFGLNDSLTMVCNFTGNPQPKSSTVKWLKANSEISKGSELKIQNLKYKDRGIYSCSAKNFEGETKKFFKVDVETAPFEDRTANLKKTMEVKQGHDAILDCSIVKASPPPNFVWFKNKERLKDNSASKLILKNVTSNDDGYYSCFAYNNNGATEIDFEVSVPESAYIIEPKENEFITLRNEENFKLTCIAKGNPVPEFWWITDQTVILGMSGDMSDSEKFNKPLNDHGAIIRNFEETNLVSIDTANYSVITKINPGTYKFVTTLSASKVQGGKLYCRVKNTPHEQPQQELILNKFQNLFTTDEVMIFRKEFMKGQKLNIKCPFVASPQPEIQWNKDGRIIHPVTDNLSIKDNGILLFAESALENHSGSYNCSVNYDGHQRVAQFDVLIHSPPSIRRYSIRKNFGQAVDSSQQTIKVLKGGDAVLECWTAGMPKPTIKWLIIDTKKGSSNKPVKNETGEIFMIHSVRSVLNYACEVENQYGKVYKSFKIEPEFAPEFLDNSEITKNVSLKEGQRDQQLKCLVRSMPQSIITWMMNNQNVTLSSEFNFKVKDQVLEIPEAQQKHTGTYACTIKNIYGSINRTFHVSLEPEIEYTSWSDWSECSGQCDTNGTKFRKRDCILKSLVSGIISCPEKTFEFQSCQNKPCWSEWKKVGQPCPACRKPYDKPVQYMHRTCLANPTTLCIGEEEKKEDCNVKLCEEEKIFSGWKVAGRSCPSCYQVGTKIPTVIMVRECISKEKWKCQGEQYKEEKCNIKVCAVTKKPEGNDWSEWSEWSPCSKTCGLGGKKTQTRTCLKKSGKCPGSSFRKVNCMIKESCYS